MIKYSTLFLTAYKNQQHGNDEEAQKYYSRCLSYRIDDPAVFLNLFVIFKKNQEILSLAALAVAFQINPENKLAINNINKLAVNLQLTKKTENFTSYERLISILNYIFDKRKFTQSDLIKLAEHEYVAGKFTNSFILYSFIKMITTKDRTNCNANLALCLQNLGNLDQASNLYDEIVRSDEASRETLNNYAILLLQQNEFVSAMAIIESALEKFPEYADAWNTKGNILARLNKNYDAIYCYRQAIKKGGHRVEFITNLTSQLITTGAFEESFSLIKDQLELENYSANLIKNYVDLTTAPLEKKYKSWVQAEINDSQVSLSKVTNYFTLAKLYDRQRDYKNAWYNYYEGNELKRRMFPFNVDEYLDRINATLRVDQCSIPLSNSEAYQPVFIVGLPRTGTSLLEQMLSMTNEFSVLGEVNHICEFFEEYDALSIESFDSYTALQTSYYEFIKQVYNPHKRFTDKMPLNYQFVNILMSTFPNSKFLMLKRDKFPTIWSLYSTNFASSGNRFAYSISDISKVYDHYIEFCNKMSDGFKDRVLLVNYSEIVNAPINSTKEVAEFLGITWSNEWLKFSNNKRAVNTASSITMRDGLLTSRDHRWTPYEAFIKEQLM